LVQDIGERRECVEVVSVVVADDDAVVEEGADDNEEKELVFVAVEENTSIRDSDDSPAIVGGPPRIKGELLRWSSCACPPSLSLSLSLSFSLSLSLAVSVSFSTCLSNDRCTSANTSGSLCISLTIRRFLLAGNDSFSPPSQRGQCQSQGVRVRGVGASA
jgi:hypothetical protein